MGILDLLFGDKKNVIKEAIDKNGSLIDVRTSEEFNMGNIKGSVNIPLDKLSANQKKISKMKTPIVVFCASGARSTSAKMMLKNSGITEVINGGGINKIAQLVNQ